MSGANLQQANLKHTEFLDSGVFYASLKDLILNKLTSFKATILTANTFSDAYECIQCT